MDAPILVTGATGNVGRYVVEELLARGAKVRAGVSSPEKASRILDPRVELIRLDFNRPETFAPAVQGTRGVFLLRPPVIGKMETTLNVLVDRALEAGNPHVVFLSVAGAETKTWVPHHKVEAHLKARNIPATILRAGFFSQNLGDAYRQDIVENNALMLPAGNARVTFVDTRDLAEVAARAFEQPSWQGQAYWLTGPESLSFDDVAATLSASLGRGIRYLPVSIPRYVAHLARRGMPLMQVAVQTVLHVGLRTGEAAEVKPALQSLLGRPGRTLAQYVADHRAVWETPHTS